MRRHERAQCGLGVRGERRDVEQLGLRARPLDDALDAQPAAPQAACPVGEVALREAGGGCEGRAEHDRELDRSGLREAADEHREGTPAEREDVVGVQGAAEQLEVVGEHEARRR